MRMIKAAFGYPVLAIAMVFAFIGVVLMALAHNMLGDERLKKLGLNTWDDPEADMFQGN